jgi:ATP-binding cassette subfamily C (CFTR/MRP) protein 2
MFDKIIKCMFSVWAAILVCYQYNAYSLLIAPILLFLSYLLVNYFIVAGRDLYRLDSISRSPIVSLFSETILGITTIRTFKREKESKKKILC